MKSGRYLVLMILLAVAVLGEPEVQSVRVVPKPVSDCNLDLSGSTVPNSGTEQLIHCWNR
jgi:hypothetical protein